MSLSVIIPSRNPEYLWKTVEDLLAKAEGELDIVIVLDGYWPDPVMDYGKQVTIVHQGTVHDSFGMREAINAGIALSKGTHIMKIDEHCMVDQGFDIKLAADCDDDWVVIPRRYRLDPDEWKLIEDGRPPIDYMYLAYPYERRLDKRCGLHGAEWRERHYTNKEIEIDDTMSWQGSCYFMSRKFWDTTIQKLDTENYGTFTHESQEIGNKAWLSGGRLVVNKKTWYAHYHKGKRGKGYGFSREQYRLHGEANEKGRQFCVDYWLNDRWPEATRTFESLLEQFWPVPTWDENWKDKIIEDAAFDWSKRTEDVDYLAL